MAEEKKLNNSEWMVVLSLILLLFTLTWVTHRNNLSLLSRDYSEPQFILDPQIQVRVEGAVEYPGVYIVERGALVQDVLIKAQPTNQADLKRLSQNKKVRDGQTLKIPSKEYISIQLKGAVEKPGVIVVAKGTLMHELPTLVKFSPGANLNKLQQKRKLKEGEVIQVDFVKKPFSDSSEHVFATMSKFFQNYIEKNDQL